MSLETVILKTLEAEVRPAMGCTEPVAVALAVCRARELAGADVNTLKKVTLHLSPNVFKNALAVGIPGTEEVGILYAAALGYIIGESADGLEVFQKVHSDAIQQARQLIKNGQIAMHIKDTQEKIYIEAWVDTYSGKHFGHTVIKGRHDQFILEENHVERRAFEEAACAAGVDNAQLFDTPIVELLHTIEALPAEAVDWMLDGIKMNRKVADAGLAKPSGLAVGYVLNSKIADGLLSKDLMQWAMVLTAAASDARMSGVSLPVMSSNGSGNNGLTALLPLAAYADLFDISDERLAKAAAMSHIVNSVVKHKIGRLSALCGCGVAAGTGAAVALAWLMGADDAALDATVQNMIANTTGMVCDGAKVGCALKLATAVQSAIQSCLLATEGIAVPSGNGIVGENADKSLYNLGVLSDKAMPTVDHTMLEVMLNQAHNF